MATAVGEGLAPPVNEICARLAGGATSGFTRAHPPLLVFGRLTSSSGARGATLPDTGMLSLFDVPSTDVKREINFSKPTESKTKPFCILRRDWRKIRV